jgi:lipopolysaccharide transport system permease protein
MSHLTGQRGAGAVFNILLGMTAWQWFEGSVLISANSIKAKFHIHQQVPLPKFLFPLVDVCINTIRFAFAFTIIVTACLLINKGPSWALLSLPAVLCIQLLFIVSLSMVVSIVVTLFSDLLLILQSSFRLLFFVSGIFFGVDRVPPHLLPYFHANPITIFIESYRAIIIDQKMPDLNLLQNALIITGFILIVGCIIQAYFDKRLLKLTNA